MDKAKAERFLARLLEQDVEECGVSKSAGVYVFTFSLQDEAAELVRKLAEDCGLSLEEAPAGSVRGFDHKKDEIPRQEWLTHEGYELHRAERKAGGYPRRKLLVAAVLLALLGAALLWVLFNRT